MLNISPNRIDARETENLQSLKLLNNPGSSRFVVRTLFIMLVVVIGAMFLPWQQNIRGEGKVTALHPEQRPQELPSLIAGRIEKWYVNEGQPVEKGDTIAVISEIKEKFFDPNLLLRLHEQVNAKVASINSTEKKSEALQNQISALNNALNYSMQKARNKLIQAGLKVRSDSADVESAKADYKIAVRQYDAFKNLYAQGLKSLTELEQKNAKLQETSAKLVSAENKYNQQRNELINVTIELNSIGADYLDKISKAESELNATFAYIYDSEAALAKMRNEYANMQIRNGLYVIKAPQKGMVVQARKTGIGETVKEGDPVVTIMPDDPELAVELYVEPMDLPLLKKGCKVRVQFDGWPALVFSGWPSASVGTFGGKVYAVDYVNSANGKFRILVVEDPETEKWPSMLRMGSGVYGWAMLNNVSAGYELWRQFNGFPPDMIKNIGGSKAGKKKSTEKDEEE